MSIESVMPSSHLMLHCSLGLLPSIFPSIRVFSSESVVHIRWVKGASASASFLPMNTQDWSPLGWTGWTSCGPRDFQESSPTSQCRSTNSSALSFLYSPNLTSVYDYWKNKALTIWTSVGKVISLLLHMLSRFVIAFLPRSKRLLTSWLQSLSTVILEPKKLRSITVTTFHSSVCRSVIGQDVRILVF